MVPALEHLFFRQRSGSGGNGAMLAFMVTAGGDTESQWAMVAGMTACPSLSASRTAFR
jgi:hypothetical protein